MATATYKKFDVKHGISVNGLPFVDENRNVTVNDLTVQGVSTIVDTRTITSVDPIITLGASGKTYSSESIVTGTPGRIKFSAENFSDIAVGDAIKYETGGGGTTPSGLTSGNVYYVVSRDNDVNSDNYRTVTVSSLQGGTAINLTTSGTGTQNWTLNPLRDLDQDLGVEFNYVSTSPKKGFFGYKDSTGLFTFLLDTTYGGSSTESDDGSPTPAFSGTKGGVEVQYIKLEPTSSLSASTPAIDIDQTWNSGGTTFQAITLDVVDTASAAGSSLIDIEVGASKKLLLRKDGALALNTSTIEAALTVAQGSIAEDTLFYGSATWNNVGTAFKGIDLQITETTFAAGSLLMNLYGGANRLFSVDAYGKISNRVEFTGGTLQTAIELDVTDTSSQANSLLLDLQVGGVSKFSVDKEGDLTLSGELVVDGPGEFEDYIDIQANPNGAGAYADNTEIQTSYVTIAPGTSTATVVNTYDKTVFCTGKYLVQVKQGSNYHSMEILLLHDGSGVFMTEYAAVSNNSIIGTMDAAISGNSVQLTLTPTAAAVAANAQIDVKINRTTLVA
jgi:hypothetical protein